MCSTDNRIKVAPRVSLSINVDGEVLPFINLKSHCISSVLFYSTMKEISVKSAPLRLLLFYICFRYLLIKTCLVFISYFVSVPLRKCYRDLEYHCWFVRWYLFLFAFLDICIEAFGFRRLFCDITCVLCGDWSPVLY